jgi:hypothetical protein
MLESDLRKPIMARLIAEAFEIRQNVPVVIDPRQGPVTVDMLARKPDELSDRKLYVAVELDVTLNPEVIAQARRWIGYVHRTAIGVLMPTKAQRSHLTAIDDLVREGIGLMYATPGGASQWAKSRRGETVAPRLLEPDAGCAAELERAFEATSKSDHAPPAGCASPVKSDGFWDEATDWLREHGPAQWKYLRRQLSMKYRKITEHEAENAIYRRKWVGATCTTNGGVTIFEAKEVPT